MKSSKQTYFSAMLVILGIGMSVIAQMPSRPVPVAPPPVQEDFTWWYISILVLVLGLAAAVGWWYKTKFGGEKKKNRDQVEDEDSVDAEAELAWLKSIKKKKSEPGDENYPDNLPKTSNVLKKNSLGKGDGAAYKEAKRKLESAKFEGLPITTFTELKEPKSFAALPLSNDDALMSAIEQTNCEDEEDPEIRELAVRILARFNTKNSVEALAQIALYDVSSSIRSKAVNVLAEIDHESVFETLLLSCADPTREVRAAAARALFQVTFDRADSWTRIANSNDEFRMVQAARAAIESDLVERSIERLVHDDAKHAYEAFVLVALLVRSGETMEIFQILESHANKYVKLALIHVFKTFPDERAHKHLTSYMVRNTLPDDIGKAVNDCIREAELVPV